RLALGGLLLGLLLLLIPQVAGNGYSVVYSLLHTPWAWHAVILILVCKGIATAITVGSGAVGGGFTPALFVGGALGTLLGMVVQALIPGAAAPVSVYTLVGVGGFMGAAPGALMMAILMIFELTLRYQIVLPMMLAGVVSYFVSRAVAEVTMYDVTAARERDVVLRYRLRTTVINELIKPADTVIRLDTPLEQALQMFVDYPVRYIYVVDENNVFKGAVAQQI